jgi:hypothetical protein
MSAVASLVALGNAADFGNPTTVAHCSDYVQVTIHTLTGDRVYARRIRQRSGLLNAWGYSAQMARQCEEAAALVSSPALVAWLLDCGFALVQ